MGLCRREWDPEMYPALLSEVVWAPSCLWAPGERPLAPQNELGVLLALETFRCY